jgi:phage gpG-like protein
MITSDVQNLIRRIEAKLNVLDFADAETSIKFTRIALLLENQTKLNVRKERLVDTGALMNSITSQVVKKSRVEASVFYGSVGVRYAAFHEFGLRGNVNVSSHTRTRKGTSFNVRGHSRAVNYDGRPYIRPSLVTQRRKILRILKGED